MDIVLGDMQPIEDCVVKKMWVEDGKMDDCPTDPYGVTDPQDIHKDIIKWD